MPKNSPPQDSTDLFPTPGDSPRKDRWIKPAFRKLHADEAEVGIDFYPEVLILLGS